MKTSITYALKCLMVLILFNTALQGCAPAPRQAAYIPPPPPLPSAPIATVNVKDITRITHDPAIEFYPRISPDGAQLLFTTRNATRQSNPKPEEYSLVLIDIGKAGRRLVAGPYAVSSAWYPDGKKFAYVYLKMNKPVLVRTSLSGAGMTFISPTALGEKDGQPDISPAGDKIAFHTKMGNTTNICTVDANGSNFTVYAEGASPRWSPSGMQIAFDREVSDNNQCFIFDITSGQVTQLTQGPSDNIFPVWSPDGNWLAFTSNRDGKNHLYIMKSDGSNVTQLTKGETREATPQWSSDGLIYFISNAGAPSERTLYSDIWRLKPVLSE